MNKNEKKEYMREWHKKHPEKKKQYDRKDYLKRKERYLQLAKKRYLEFGEKIRPWNAEYNKNRRREFKELIFKHYSNNTSVCACCGESEFDFLTLDHMNNDGVTHRKKVGSAHIYKDLINSAFPKGYAILCMNCNFARSLSFNKGICPHKRIKQ